MAATMRPSVLRHTSLFAPAKRVFSTNSSIPHSVRAASIPSLIAKRPSPVGSTVPRDTIQGSLRVAAFHASAKKAILPQGPQVIRGTANDAARVPGPHPTEGSYHWTFERLLSAGLVPLTLAPFVAGSLNPVTDAIFCGAILIHSHIGFQSIIIDYVSTWGYPTLRKAMWWLLRVATLVVGVGLYEFETNDVGVTEGVKRVWRA